MSSLEWRRAQPHAPPPPMYVRCGICEVFWIFVTTSHAVLFVITGGWVNLGFGLLSGFWGIGQRHGKPIIRIIE